MGDGGKGDSYRQVVWDKYSTGYDNIFNKNKVKVSGVPYEVEMDDMVSELERENFMLRARVQRLEEELDKFRDDGK
jgi:hypothetical protein